MLCLIAGVIEYSDKILIKNYIESRVGKKYVAETFQIHEKFQQIDFEKLPNAFVIKANHDTGSVILVKNKASFDLKKAERKITKALNRVYGWTKGEWAYSYIVPKVLVEEYIGTVADSPPPDYKFHCVNGKVRFCQYIYDRGVDTKEVITDKRGIPFNFVLFEDFKQGSGFNIPEKWSEMIKVAEILSENFKYVRVDMYCVDNRLIVGEMTFHPKFGCYVGDGQKKLGKLLDFDRDTYIPCQYIKPGPL